MWEHKSAAIQFMGLDQGHQQQKKKQGREEKKRNWNWEKKEKEWKQTWIK